MSYFKSLFNYFIQRIDKERTQVHITVQNSADYKNIYSYLIKTPTVCCRELT